MDETGGGLSQHTRHSGWDVRDAALSGGRIVYQVGADLWLFEVATAESRRIPITLASDVDQWRDKWVKKPMKYLTSVRLHPQGESVVLTARGRVFVAPAKAGRLRRASRQEGVRYRDAVFMPDGEKLLALSDESGELEFVELPADGVGDARTVTADGAILRFAGHPSPDGKHVAYTDQNRDLWLLELASGEQKVISSNRQGARDITWSPDSRWIAFVQDAINSFNQIQLYGLVDGSLTEVTSDRVNSWGPAWDPAGDWLYFQSDRKLRSLVGSPWGTRQPEPYFDKPDLIYQVALRRGLRSPFKPLDELYEPAEDDKDKDRDEEGEKDGGESKEEAVEPVVIELEGLRDRVYEVPAPAGNATGLKANSKTLFWLARDSGPDAKWHLMALPIKNEGDEPEQLVENVSSYELSLDGKKLLVRRQQELFVFDAGAKSPAELAKHKVPLEGWTFAIDAREDWRQIFIDAWRLERDYFYDPGMHGLDWDAVRDKYLPLVDRVTTRAELSELIGRAVGELSALHTSVRGGDHRQGPDEIEVASLGARLVRDEAAGGYRVDYIYRSDPDYPDERSPLADPELEVEAGDLIVEVNGAGTLSVPHIGYLLRNQEGRQVRLKIQDADGETREAIAVPMSNEWRLRYADWEQTRRQAVEERGAGKIGYVHLQAMGSRNLTEWYRQFYPVFDRSGLIIDVRHNRGGNIDSIILEKLLRRAWFYWKGRVEEPYWNMQYAFRGHLVVLVDSRTASDGEAFAEGFRRLGLGPAIGTRTWGGEIWLGSANRLSDGGLARAPMWGVYDEDGNWLIEQHGVEPDIEVDNLPHATFNGGDLQLETAIDYLLEKIKEEPRAVPEAPPYPDLSFEYPTAEAEGHSG
jgi:tricorn protease